MMLVVRQSRSRPCEENTSGSCNHRLQFMASTMDCRVAVRDPAVGKLRLDTMNFKGETDDEEFAMVVRASRTGCLCLPGPGLGGLHLRGHRSRRQQRARG